MKMNNREKKMQALKIAVSVFAVLGILALVLTGCEQGASGSKEKPVVKAMVEKYMNAIKDQDVKTLVEMANLKMSDEIKKQATQGLEGMFKQAAEIKLKSFTIKEVKVEGSIAFVKVEETRSIKPKMGGAPGLETGEKTVEETIVLIKRDGKWKIDAMNTLHLSTLDLQDLEKTTQELNKFGLGRIMTVLVDPDVAIIGVAAAQFVGPAMMKGRSQGQATACQSNLKNIGTALEMYSTDNKGHYPDSLGKLTPGYLRMLPTCPAAGKDTYTKSYTSATEPDVFTVYCSGHHHRASGIPADHPSYSSTRGLTVK